MHVRIPTYVHRIRSLQLYTLQKNQARNEACYEQLYRNIHYEARNEHRDRLLQLGGILAHLGNRADGQRQDPHAAAATARPPPSTASCSARGAAALGEESTGHASFQSIEGVHPPAWPQLLDSGCAVSCGGTSPRPPRARMIPSSLACICCAIAHTWALLTLGQASNPRFRKALNMECGRSGRRHSRERRRQKRSCRTPLHGGQPC